jgi:tetratricopeptide (TPR) repeat protein
MHFARIALAAALATAAATLGAQDWKGTGRLEGKILDADGKPIEGATVKLANPARGGGPTVKTDKKGKWAYIGLVAGAWHVDVEAPGHAPRKMSITLPYETSRLAPVEVKLDRAAPTGPPPEVLQALSKAEDAFKAERYEDAVGEYERLLALRPDLATTIHQQIGFAHIRLRRFDKAVDHLQKVVEAEPANVQIRAIAAQAALEGGMLDRGLELLKGIDESAITNPDVFYNIAVNFLNANQPEHAITYFTKAVTVEPAYADGYFRRALAYIQMQRVEEAKADLRKVVELTPEGAQADAARKTLEQLK